MHDEEKNGVREKTAWEKIFADYSSDKELNNEPHKQLKNLKY